MHHGVYATEPKGLGGCEAAIIVQKSAPVEVEVHGVENDGEQCVRMQIFIKDGNVPVLRHVVVCMAVPGRLITLSAWTNSWEA